MRAKSLDRLLSQLEEARYRFGPGDATRILKLLNSLGAARFFDARSLIRFHEALLFLRAFPQSSGVVRKTESLLNSFHLRVEALRESRADLSLLEPLEVSGIAGTQMSDTISFELARWLVGRRTRMPAPRVQVSIDWENWDEGRAMASTLPRFLPLLEDDAFVEADTPWRRWIEAACPQGLKPPFIYRTNAALKGRSSTVAPPTLAPTTVARPTVALKYSWRFEAPAPKGTLSSKSSAASLKRCPDTNLDVEWLIRRFEGLPISDREKAELYDSLRVPLRWELGNSRMSRTRNWEATGDAASRSLQRGPILARRGGSRVSSAGRQKVFFHEAPLITRSQVSLAAELAKKPPRLVRLSRRAGEQIIDKIREVMLVRYRELYGTTLGDPASVVRSDVGRGVSIYLWNLPPERRLPLRAYTAGLTLKNGVPINYIEAIGLCEWMEVGFNTFYTFRGGEAGWIYAQVLRCLCHLMGTTCVSVYPYQLGHDNDEAIESGAFWFYRKLGFRPGRKDLERLVEREEKKIAASREETSKRRTTGYTEEHGGALRRSLEYRTPATILKRLASGHVFYELPGCEVGAWDRFSTRNIGLRVNEQMARDFGGDARSMREKAVRDLERGLGVKISTWSALEKDSFENFALVLSLVPGVAYWKSEDRDALVKVIRAKSAANEMRYLHLSRTHTRLRSILLHVGS